MRAFGETIQGACVQLGWRPNRGVSLADKEVDKDGLALLEDVT